MPGLFWRTAAVFLIVGLFYVGTGLHRGAGRAVSPHSFPSLTGRAYAGGIGVATNNTETVMTTSEDGRVVYVWRYVGVKPPMFLGKAEVGDRDR